MRVEFFKVNDPKQPTAWYKEKHVQMSYIITSSSFYFFFRKRRRRRNVSCPRYTNVVFATTTGGSHKRAICNAKSKEDIEFGNNKKYSCFHF